MECTDYPLTNYSVAEREGYPCYIAAEIDASTIQQSGYEFLLGTGGNYGGYENVRLIDGEKYTVYTGVVVVLDVSPWSTFNQS